MDSISFIIGTIAGVITAVIILIVDVKTYGKNNLQRPEPKPVGEKTEIPVPQKQEEPKAKRPKVELGAIKRPSIEDIEKKTTPKLKEEEEAWDESIGEIFKTSPYKIGIQTS